MGLKLPTPLKTPSAKAFFSRVVSKTLSSNSTNNHGCPACPNKFFPNKKRSPTTSRVSLYTPSSFTSWFSTTTGQLKKWSSWFLTSLIKWSSWFPASTGISNHTFIWRSSSITGRNFWNLIWPLPRKKKFWIGLSVLILSKREKSTPIARRACHSFLPTSLSPW